MRISVLRAAALLAACLSAFPAPAQEYPQKLIRLIVPYSPGGGTDILGRLAAKDLSEALGQPVIVENKPGAMAIIGTDQAAKAAPDGYTLLMAPSSVLAMNPVLRKTLPYSAQKDFVPISVLGRLPLLVLVKPSLPVMSIKELVDYAKANPTNITYASSAPLFQLATELFKQKTGTNFLGVNYKSSGDSAIALMSGEITLSISDVASVASLVKNGDLRALAYTNDTRNPEFPDVPTVAEAGLPGTEIATLVGIVAPTGTPAPIVRKLQGALIRMVNKPDIRERFASLGVEPMGSTSEEFAKAIKEDTERWAAVAKRAGIEPE
jgi:tripartite-type tricarboxylate transporter receptor subunit TctC